MNEWKSCNYQIFIFSTSMYLKKICFLFFIFVFESVRIKKKKIPGPYYFYFGVGVEAGHSFFVRGRDLFSWRMKQSRGSMLFLSAAPLCLTLSLFFSYSLLLSHLCSVLNWLIGPVIFLFAPARTFFKINDNFRCCVRDRRIWLLRSCPNNSRQRHHEE